MGDAFFENEISEMPVTVYNVTVRNTSFLFDSLGFYSSMDDIFTHLLTLASYISRRFVQFVKDLARRDADRYSDDLLVNSAGQLLRSLRHSVCNSFSESCSSSSKPCTSGQNPGICERASEAREDTRCGVEDGTARFLELLAGIRNGGHKLPSSFVYLLIPGLFSNRGPLYFVGTKKFFSKMGLACHIAKIHSEAYVAHNAWELKQYMGDPVSVLCCQGTATEVCMLQLHCQSTGDLKDKVAGLALVQSPYGGTPLASDFLRRSDLGEKLK